MIETVESEADLRRVSRKTLAKLLREDLREIADTLGEAIFAAYLLGLALAREENAAATKTADFAENDKLAAKAGPLELRFDVPPREAIDYFARKKIIPKREFKQLEDDAKSAAFTVGGVYEQKVLDGFHSEILDALKNGRSHKDVAKNFKKILDGAGHSALGDSRLELIARTNIQTAYGVGRRRALEESADLLPYWEYSAVGDDRTRPSHRALDGVILPANHQFWDSHYPPWGFNCRCTVFAVGEMPDGYDPKKPNEEATIAYDSDGNPTKAEIDTQVVDLSAGKFRGVPRQGVKLKETIVEATQESAKTELSSAFRRKKLTDPQSDVKDEVLWDLPGADLETKIQAMARQMRNKNFRREHGVMLDADGTVLHYEIGGEKSVQMRTPLNIPTDGKTIVHWHPSNREFPSGSLARSGGAISPRDICSAAKRQLSEVIAVADNATYRIKSAREDGTWSPLINQIITATIIKNRVEQSGKIERFIAETAELRQMGFAEQIGALQIRARREQWTIEQLREQGIITMMRIYEQSLKMLLKKYELVYLVEKVGQE